MHSDIYYFTGTGNSLHAGRMIAKRLGDCTLVPIVRTLAGGQPVTGERIIIVFPVYMYRAPHIVCRFVRKISAAKSVIAIATMGGGSGKTFLQLRSLLRKNGLDLDAGYAVAMPDNYTPFGDAMAGDELNIRLKEAGEKIDKIAVSIGKNDRTFEKDTSFFQTYVWPGVWFWYAYIVIPKLARYYRVQESCDGCGICARVCPSGAVTLKSNRPQWSVGCEHCLACLQWCPKEAIQFGKRTAGKKRYKNLFVSVKDIIAQK